MKLFARIAIAAVAAGTLVGSAEAMPIATQPSSLVSASAPIEKTAVVVTTTRRVVRRPIIRRRPVVTRVIRRVIR